VTGAVRMLAALGVAFPLRQAPGVLADALARIGALVKRPREHGLQREAVARALGLSERRVRHLETGRIPVTLALLERIAEAIGCAPSELLPE